MKKIYCFCLLSFIILGNVSAQLLFNDDFNYTSGTTLVSNGWTQVPAVTTSPISVNSKALAYSGYAGSGNGNAVLIGNVGQDVYRDAALAVTTNNLYASFLINDSVAKANGNYFFSFASQTLTTSVGKVFIKSVSSGYYRMGVSKGTEAAIYSTDSFAMQTTYLCVLKYQFNSANRDDSLKLFVFNNGMPLAEPTMATAETMGGTSADATSLGRVILTQGDTTSSPILNIDGIRLATSWDKLNGTSTLFPYPVTTITSVANSTSAATISWTKPINYDSTTMKTLVFVKQSSVVTQGTPTFPSNYYVANSNYTLSPTRYQNDTAAHCVFNSIENSFVVSGLTASGTYIVLIYVVSNTDSLYSKATTATFTTLASPTSVNTLAFSSINLSSAKVTWTRPAGYNVNTMTTLVFMKPINAITLTTPIQSPNAFVSDTNFVGVGSSLPSDVDAKCIYKGDTNYVNISSLIAGTNYYLVAYVVRDADSAYSIPRQINASLQTAVTAVTSLTFIGLTMQSAKINWIKSPNYNNTKMTTVVFVKAISSIYVSSYPSQSIGTYNADTVLGNGSKYQNDTAAFCVYKGDSSFVTVTGLNASTLYYVLAYAVRDSDDLYSISTIASGTTKAAPPSAVSNVNLTGFGQTTARATWTKPTNYTNATYTTLVFLKQSSAVNAGTPTRTITYYTAQANFASTGSTKYQNDPLAKCVYKGDTNYVNITGLTSNTRYDLLVYVVRDADSTYSANADGFGFTFGVPAAKNIADVNTSNATTGDADSLAVRATLRGVVYGFNQRRANQGGLQFLLKDVTGGINVTYATKNFGYTVKEGDSIEVQGIIASNNGMVSIAALDTLMRLDSNKIIENPMVFNTLNESTENKLVRIDGVKFLTTPTGTTWPVVRNTGTTTVSLIKSNGVDTITVRLASTNTLSGSPLPQTTYFSIIGIGSQTSTSNAAPYAFNGYQILPRVASDVLDIPDSLSAFNLNSVANNDTITLSGNPNGTFLLNWNSSKALSGVTAPKYTVIFDTASKIITAPIYYTLSSNIGNDTLANIKYIDLINALDTTIKTHHLRWVVLAQTGNYFKMSDTFNLVVNIGTFWKTSINELANNNAFQVYPNPAKDIVNMESRDKINEVALYDMTGKEILLKNNINSTSYKLNVDGLPKGIYLLKTMIDTKESLRKIIIE